MTQTQATAPKKRNTSLKREVGLIGLTWASMGSIIGSGWLFGPQDALEVAGPARPVRHRRPHGEGSDVYRTWMTLYRPMTRDVQVRTW